MDKVTIRPISLPDVPAVGRMLNELWASEHGSQSSEFRTCATSKKFCIDVALGYSPSVCIWAAQRPSGSLCGCIVVQVGVNSDCARYSEVGGLWVDKGSPRVTALMLISAVTDWHIANEIENVKITTSRKHDRKFWARLGFAPTEVIHSAIAADVALRLERICHHGRNR